MPLFASPISAGFPSPADDYVEKKLDLNEHLIANRQATFFLRVSGDSMVGAGIHDRTWIAKLSPGATRSRKALPDKRFQIGKFLRCFANTVELSQTGNFLIA